MGPGYSVYDYIKVKTFASLFEKTNEWKSTHTFFKFKKVYKLCFFK